MKSQNLNTVKLLSCPHCGDIVHLTTKSKSCGCGAVGGAKTGDNLYSTWGNGLPLEFEHDFIGVKESSLKIIKVDKRNIINLKT